VPPRISLALVIHNHQPVGNFGWVIEHVFEQAYEPLVAALERHPCVRLSLHYTGALLDWLVAERPGFIAALRALVDRGQVEMIGGGLYEPVLTSIPERDRRAQLERMADEVERLFGRRPRGAWLAERVWEPDLPVSLADSGYRWTILDDHHFRGASIDEENLWGAFVTDDQGRLLHVFGTDQRLRYTVPFGRVEEVIDHLRDHATEDGRRLATMGDDGEKFGAWPGTFEHCWGATRWIGRFFEALERNRDWLTTVTPSEWLEREPPVGRMYAPTSSYIEMGEWALPPHESTVFTDIVKRAVAEGRPERRWLRGGFWRNYQVRYREVNDLHKQMLRASAKVDRMPLGEARDRATDHLHRGQSNDCYWHGLFGGVYIVHMRMATLAQLIAAEDLADESTTRVDDAVPWGGVPAVATAGTSGYDGLEILAGAPAVGATMLDTDLDGVDEAFLATVGQVVVVDLAEGAAIGSWDLRAARLAMLSVLRRRPEAYHETIIRQEHSSDEAAAGEHEGGPGDDAPAPRGAAGAGIIAEAPHTIHDLVILKEAGLGRRIVYDQHERRSALVHLVAPGTRLDAYVAARQQEWSDTVDGAYVTVALEPGLLVAERATTLVASVGSWPIRVRKSIRVLGGRSDPTIDVTVDLQNVSDAGLQADLVMEWNLDLAGGGGNPAAWYRVGDGRFTHDSVRDGDADGGSPIESLGFGNDHEGIEVAATLEPAAVASWYPVETVSNSESGFERAYQGSCLLVRWPLLLAPRETERFRVRLDATCRRDRLAEERERAPWAGEQEKPGAGGPRS
jgi:4-alpha-glucanotransferase